jgi:hypothetical protein
VDVPVLGNPTMTTFKSQLMSPLMSHPCIGSGRFVGSLVAVIADAVVLLAAFCLISSRSLLSMLLLPSMLDSVCSIGRY